MPKQPASFPSLTADLRRRIVETTAENVRQHYIFERDAATMADALLSKLQEGAFDGIDDLQKLTRALTSEIHAIREDLHLAALAWMPSAEDTPCTCTGEDIAALQRVWKRNNHEFRKIEILLGNVGYANLRGFATAEHGGPTAAATMQFLQDTDALIFDLRENTGGRDLVYYVMSYLFDKPTHLHTAHFRDHDEQAWTYGYVPGRRFPNQPVYILISRATFSAGEDFSYNLQQLGRATIIGEQTKGGAHPVEFYRFPELYLQLAIPNAYSENPISEGNWEDTGVVPDIAVPAADALLVAHEQALETLLDQSEDDEQERFRAWALESIQLRRKPFECPSEASGTYVGRYGAGVSIERSEDGLVFSWDGHTYRMIPLSEHRFEIDEGLQRLTFTVAAGEATEFLWETEDGDSWRIRRKDDS